MIYLPLICLMLGSCSKDNLEVGSTAEPESLTIDSEVLSLLKQAKFNTEDVTTDILEHPDGSKEAVYLLEGDVYITPEILERMAHNHSSDGVHNRQYSTDELVDNNQTIKVLGYQRPGYSSNLKPGMVTALGWAINNYNNLNIGLDFELTIGNTSNFNNYDIVVYRYANGQDGGIAGFPVNGAPHKWVRIYDGMDDYDTNTIEHVMTHEIGHCVGLRHTDWFSRQSCGWGSVGEQPGDVGANWIQGTQPAFDPNSVMLSCFQSQEDGEFGYYDRKALRELY